jgi:hypothetical protein
MLSEESQAQKVKGHMFSLIYGSQIYKLNVYIGTYMIIYMYHDYIYNIVTEQNCIGGILGQHGDSE